jgi:cell division protein FtsA
MRNNVDLPTFAGIDIGTSFVRCVIGTIDEQGRPEIIGHGESRNMGMRKGVVVHPDEVTDSVIQAVGDAERLSGRRVRFATVNINGSHVLGVNSRGVIAISAANRQITVDDRLRVEEAAAVMQMPANREIVQLFPKAYRLDGQDNIKDPVGMQGVRLEVDTHIVTASTPSINSLEAVFDKSNIQIKHRTVSGLASAETVLTRQQREAGSVVIDIGAGTTNLVVIEDGEVQHVATIPVGGIHVTNDLAIGLRTDLDIAEKVKLEHAKLVNGTARSTVSVFLDKQQHTFSAHNVYMIIEARVEELLELVDKELKKIQKSRKLPGGAIFVGGGSKIVGLADFAKEKLQLPARIGEFVPIGGLGDITDNLSYATPVGLMLLDMLLDGQSVKGQSSDYTGILDSISGVFKKFRKK